MKNLLLNKGWAGKTLSREETAARLNPVIHAHCALNHSHEYAIRALKDRRAAEKLSALQKTARMDVGKLSEAVLSAGGVPSGGAAMEPEDFDLGTSDGAIATGLRDMERDFERSLHAELDAEHQMRTRAILQAVLKNTRIRLEYARKLVLRHR